MTFKTYCVPTFLLLCFPKISEWLDIAMGTGTYNLLLVSSHLKLLKASWAQIYFFQKTRTELCGLRRTQVAALFGQLGSEFVIELRKRSWQKQFGARMSHQSLTSLLGSCSTMHYDKVKGLASKCHSCNRPQMETLNHLFIHSDLASFLWNKVSSIFGLNLVSNEGICSRFWRILSSYK